MLEPPVDAGATHVKATVVLPAVPATVVGASGTPLRVTVTDCGESTSVVCALPAVSVTENDAAAVNVDTTPTPFVVAVDTATTVQTVDDV